MIFPVWFRTLVLGPFIICFTMKGKDCKAFKMGTRKKEEGKD